jgi:hypothetical protein
VLLPAAADSLGTGVRERDDEPTDDTLMLRVRPPLAPPPPPPPLRLLLGLTLETKPTLSGSSSASKSRLSRELVGDSPARAT